MSTWLYLRCMDHDPPLEADEESGQHLYDLPQIRADLADREALVRVWDGEHEDMLIADLGYFRQHTARFLAKHRKCRIEIWDEYGRQHSTEVGR